MVFYSNMCAHPPKSIPRACYKITLGFTYIELMVTLTMLTILATAAMPMLQLTAQRQKEVQLRSDLRQIREAIDAYKAAVDQGHIKKGIDDSGYPPNLEILVEGLVDEKDLNKSKIRFLRRIPLDPMRENNQAEPRWGLRSYISEPENPRAGDDVYDIYSLSAQIGLNGVPYSQW